MATIFDAWQFGSASWAVASATHARPEAIDALQRQRLAALLEVVRDRSSFYRDRFKGLPAGPEALLELQPVHRRELMDRFDEWVCDPDLNLEGLRHFTADHRNIGEPYLGRYLVWESSGTSGSPGIFVQDAHCMALYDALEGQRRSAVRLAQRLFDPLGLGERIAFVGVTDGHFASYVTVERLRRLQPWMASSVRSFSILQPQEALLAQLQDFSPTVLASYPQCGRDAGPGSGRPALVPASPSGNLDGGRDAQCRGSAPPGAATGGCGSQQLWQLGVSGDGVGMPGRSHAPEQ